MNQIKEVLNIHDRVDYRQKKTWQSLGKNGWMHTDGLHLWMFDTARGEPVLRIIPRNSKAMDGRACIEIPFTSINDFCRLIYKMKKFAEKG